MGTVKMVFFETEDRSGVCDRDDRERFEYENNIKPLRLNMLDCSKGYRKQLLNLFKEDTCEFTHQIKEELDASLYIHSN